jgi:hypothetical protein
MLLAGVTHLNALVDLIKLIIHEYLVSLFCTASVLLLHSLLLGTVVTMSQIASENRIVNDILQPTAEELLVAQVILNYETEWSIMWEMIRYKMLSLSDATGHRTALTAFRNCIYLLPLGFLAHQSACQRNYSGSIPISSSKQFCVGSFLES